jgi:hypothetical protein
MIAEKYREGLAFEGNQTRADEVAQELEKLRTKVGPVAFPSIK